MAPDNNVQQFANYLASLADPEAAKKALRQANLLAMNATPDEAFEAPIRTLEDYLAAAIEVPPVLIHPKLVVRGGLNVTVGRAGKGKTVMNLNRMLRWSAGLPMFDGHKDTEGELMLAPDEPLKILIIENEGAAGMFHEQVGIMTYADPYLNDESRKLALNNTLIWGEGGYSNLKFDDEEKLNLVRAGIEKWKADIVYVEPLRSLWRGEENSSTDMNAIIDALVNIATDYECGVIVAHHERKGGAADDDKMSAARGSSALEGVVTVMEHFESVVNDEFRELDWSKSRHGNAPAPVRMEWDPEHWWYKWVPSTSLEDKLVQLLQQNTDEFLTRSDFTEMTGEKEATVKKALRSLKESARIVENASDASKGGRGSTGLRYRLPTTNDTRQAEGGISI